MMKVFAAIFCCVFVVNANVLQTRESDLWDGFMAKHNRAYKSEVEQKMRKTIFLENLKTIDAHNKKYEEGLTTYEMGINKFTDMLPSEFAEVMLNQNREILEEEVVERVPKIDGEAPDSIDWRTKGAVSEVKSQGSCGACWTFASTGALESHTFLKTGTMVELSQQNLIDCVTKGSNGCKGGLEYYGWEYVRRNGGINTEDAYPYEAEKKSCRYNDNEVHVGATCTGVVRLPKGDEEQLKLAVGTIGPISIGIDARSAFQYYKGGILTDNECTSHRLNHSVLVVGYGTENGEDYWIVKNSYGKSYGEDGYFRLARNKNNMCGVASDGSYPTV